MKKLGDCDYVAFSWLVGGLCVCDVAEGRNVVVG